MKIFAATKNSGKLKEIKRIMAGFDIVSPADTGIELDVDEDGSDFLENALIKAHAYAGRTGMAVLGDDSGLEVDCLGGAPGVYTARYSGENATDDENIDKLLRNMQGVTERTARFKCAVALVMPNGTQYTAEGCCEGSIGYERRGTGGFGYDPIFMVGDRSYSELTAGEKDEISHRGRALAALYERIKNEF